MALFIKNEAFSDSEEDFNKWLGWSAWSAWLTDEIETYVSRKYHQFQYDGYYDSDIKSIVLGVYDPNRTDEVALTKLFWRADLINSYRDQAIKRGSDDPEADVLKIMSDKADRELSRLLYNIRNGK